MELAAFSSADARSFPEVPKIANALITAGKLGTETPQYPIPRITSPSTFVVHSTAELSPIQTAIGWIGPIRQYDSPTARAPISCIRVVPILSAAVPAK
eukprot:scaffold952_cov409-Prasinococcus_capsulatus_cf.AAC.25